MIEQNLAVEILNSLVREDFIDAGMRLEILTTRAGFRPEIFTCNIGLMTDEEINQRLSDFETQYESFDDEEILRKLHEFQSTLVARFLSRQY